MYYISTVNKKVFCCIFLLLFFSSGIAVIPVFSQEFMTAPAFFDTVSQRYRRVNNYTADISIQTDEQEMRGSLSFLAPHNLRIDFTNPNGQTIVSNGEICSIYIPRYNVVLQQQLQNTPIQETSGLASEAGLQLLRENYSIAYSDSPEATLLDPDSNEMVRVLNLAWRNSSEGFREITLYITEDLIIRRVVGITAHYQTHRIDYTNIQINRGVPLSIFDYDIPPSANIYNDFLFSEN